MSKRNNIDDILKSWPYEHGNVVARTVRTRDGREVVQMRVEMGILQMEVEGRPDGERPSGFDTYFDFLKTERRESGEDFVLSEEQCAEADREFVQFYHRRMCWLTLREFDRAVRDADHTLAFMDFVRECSPEEDWTISHEQYRPFVLFHRVQAAALDKLEGDGPEDAILVINGGLNQFQSMFDDFEMIEDFDDEQFVGHLEQLKESIREHYEVGKTLSEKLADAVAAENYELAARFRDELTHRKMPGL